jgi:cation:H+ antiporter
VAGVAGGVVDQGPPVRPGRQQLALAAALGVGVPAIVLRVLSPHISHALEAAVYCVAIIGAAFVLSWAAETAQLDISAGLSIAVIAFIAVLPEYAVGVVFALHGGTAFHKYGAACRPPGSNASPDCSLALANMTGANRLLIGVGWSVVVFIAWYRWRRRGVKVREVGLERSHSVELGYLAIATAYSLTLPLKRTVTLLDAAILVVVFVAYTIRISRAPAEEPELVGPARYLATLTPLARRLSVVVLLLASAAVIVMCAEPFAHALVATGTDFGVSQFFLVQWVAPIASEAPELLVAGLYAWRLNTNAGLGTLVSSKVNQWTLLVGTLPVVFALAARTTHGLPLTPAPREELFLTAAQSVFAVAVLASLSISLREAGLLFVLFWAQFALGSALPGQLHAANRIGVSVLYLVLGAAILIRDRKRLGRLLREGLFMSYADLREDS